jgi:acyl transferase domain-containing protein
MAPLYAPVAAAQEEVMRTAYRRSDREPLSADYVELHATGTAAGDPTEANWVGSNFRSSGGSQLLCGSVKGNLGYGISRSWLFDLSEVDLVQTS